MFRSVIASLIAFIAALTGAVGFAQPRSVGLISPDVARQYGLEPSWFTTVVLDPTRAHLEHLRYFVSATKANTVFEVHYGDRKRVFSALDLDRMGEELGKERAEKLANEFFDDLQAQKIEAKVESIQVPEITLYAVSDRAMVHAIDAETGRTCWARVVGNRGYPTSPPGISEEYVAVLNGTTLYLLKRDTGEIAWSRRVDGVPAAGPAIAMGYVYVPTYSGNVEMYEIAETRTLPEIYKSNGRVMVQPVVTPLSVAWPTDRGFLYVAKANEMGLRYRLEARDVIVSQAAHFSPGRLMAASVDGYVYCLEETRGTELWRFSAGEPISNTPVPIGDSAYIVTDKENLFCLSLETGAEKWSAPHVQQFIAASKDRLYCLGSAGRLFIMDPKTGGRIGMMGMDLLNVRYTNMLTDRIIVGTRSGVLQCLRETGQQWPLVHVDLAEKEETSQRPEIKQEGLPEGGAKPAAGQPKPAAPGDPFAGGQNPFAAGGQNPFGGAGAAAPPAGGQDPFGGAGNASPPAGGENPFGGAGNPSPPAGGENPFGGAGTPPPPAGDQNPFGTGPAPPPAGGQNPFGP